ncbi:MAG: hypothetical protein KAI14_02265, partial [Dehalococcoidales bacterium]|nr:hypothetical protein [Dehalococcoidales bacterium]
MTARRFKMVVVILVFALLVSIIPACQPVFAAESYLAVVPRVLHSGGSESISLALFKGDNLVPGEVEVTLLKEGQEVLKVKENIYGKGTIELDIPDIEEGDYEIRVKSNGFEDIASVKVEKSFLVFLETDKPIYKPGQTIHMRVFTLNPELRPESEPVTIEVLDAKGIKIFRSELSSDEYGMASLDLPLSPEPNLGVWKINAATGKAESQLDVRVEEYVLPKYEVKAELPREWFLVGEAITGTVSAEYSFGKAVKGELEIIASKYVGDWEEYATFTTDIDGQAEFELPAAGYVAGVPGAGGQGNVMLDITVREMATGYEEKINKLLTIAETPHNLQIIAEGLAFKPGLPFSFLIISETPDNQPVDTTVAVTVTYLDNEYREINSQEKEIDTTRGKAIVELTPPRDSVALIIEAFEL